MSAEQLIRTIHATPFELFVLTNNQFFRLDTALSLKEVRILSTDRPLFGTPVFSDNVFMRISQALNNRQVIELHLTKIVIMCSASARMLWWIRSKNKASKLRLRVEHPAALAPMALNC
ncbi:MAG: hypothetical protein HC817_07390 [Saprospiraceae bacterium]|nr:hypothetical protein [Saprospiraceae bacterium]